MRRIAKVLSNPFALVMQGFLAGAALFWTTASPTTQAQLSAVPTAATTQIAGLNQARPAL